MYNGIGLPTPRGSGTNGYVQRNFALVRGRKEKVDYKTEDDIKRLDAAANKKPNQEILDHERKRKLELKCMELEDLMEEQGGYSKEEIERKVSEFRRMLLDKDDTTEKCIAKDEFGRPIVRETHQIAEANQDKNQRLREAFGISQYFVEGSSLDPNRREKEKAAAQANQTTQNNEVKEPKSYPILRDSSSSPEPETSKKKKKKKQALNERERSESPDSKKNKKKKTKKHKRERSDLTSPPAKKKKKTREHKHKHKKSHSPLRRDKKKKNYQFSSDSDHNSSSDSDSDDSRLQKKDDNQVRKQSHISRTREKVNETSRLKSPNIRKRFDSSDQKQRNSNHSTLSASENVSPAYYENKNSTSSLAPISGKAKSYEVEKRRDSKFPEIVHKQQRKEKMKSVIEIQHSQEQVVSSSNASSESDPSSDSSPVSSRNCSPHELLNKRNIEEIEKSDSLLKSKSQTDEQESARKLNSVVHQEAYAAENKSSPIQKRTRDISPQQIRQSTTKNGCSSSPETSSLKKIDKSRVNNSCSRSRSHSDEDDDEERNIKRIPSLSPPRAYGGKANLRSRSQSLSHSRSRSPRSKSGSESRSRSRSRSQSWQRDRKRSHSSSRSLSFSPENRRRSRSRSRSVSRNRSRSNRSSTRSRSHSYSDSRSRSASTGRRSPSIPRRRGSPSFLDKRRITSARKRPIPYHRPTPPTPSSLSSWSYRSRSTSYDRSLSRSRSRSRSRSWSRPRSNDSSHR